MTTKTDEQERAEFEAWHAEHYAGGDWSLDRDPIDSDEYADLFLVDGWEAWKARAALQAQPINGGWKEAAIAWEVCASIHRQYCKGKDPFFKTRQADFVRHAADSRDRAVTDETLQSQDAEDSVQRAITKLDAMTPRAPTAITYDQGWAIIDVVQRELCHAIDHARRVEGADDA